MDINFIYLILFLVSFFCCLGPHLRHMEVVKLGVKSELQLPIYTTTTATPDPSCICQLRCSMWQRQILNPLSKVRDQTCILMDISQALNPLCHCLYRLQFVQPFVHCSISSYFPYVLWLLWKTLLWTCMHMYLFAVLWEYIPKSGVRFLHVFGITYLPLKKKKPFSWVWRGFSVWFLKKVIDI